MYPIPVPANERERIEALWRCRILDTSPEDSFDALARLASDICATPVALISLVDTTRQWFKARIGFPFTETPREIAICAHAITGDDLFIVPDLTEDPRFAASPLLTEEHIRFYAGAPLTTPEGLNLGTLCVMDRCPRTLNDVQCDALRALARQVVVQIELRRDIAERTRAELELDRFFDLSVDLLCIAGIDGYFKRLNPAFETLLGYQRDELLARPFFDFVHPGDREATIGELVNVRRGMKTTRFANRYLCKDGTTKWLSWTASPATPEGLIYATARDITGTRESEEALRISEARTRSIIDNLLGGLVTTDHAARIESVNPAAERMFGYPAPALIGQSIGILFDETFGNERLRREALGRVSEWRGVRSNGESFVCELSVFEFDAGDRQRHFAAHMLDISEREEVERLKRDFVATVSHELRTPLTSIHGSLGLLASGVMGELNDEAARVVSVAERNSVRLVSLINDILEFEKLDEGTPVLDLRPVSIQHVFERSTETVAPLAAQEGVSIDIEPCASFVVGDEKRLAQVLVNLLSNAVKYSSRGGVVTVSAARADDGFIEVRVRDLGTGIPVQAQKKIFQRFHRIDSGDAREKSGTGLGLAICRAIVHQHGGEIGVESAPGKGSTFWFRVPVAGVATEKSA